jgi:ribosomal protein L18
VVHLSREKDILAQKVNKTEKSKLVGQAIARKAKELGIETVVFDRGGYLYHGRVKQWPKVRVRAVLISNSISST